MQKGLVVEAESPGGLPPNAEENVAARIRTEREARAWSTATVAEKMTEVGVPMNQSAVWRIESGDPPRRINLDEAIGFAKIFELSLERLIGPPELALNPVAAGLMQSFIDAWTGFDVAQTALSRARKAIDDYEEEHPDQRIMMEGLVAKAVQQLAGHRWGRPSPPRAFPVTDYKRYDIARVPHPGDNHTPEPPATPDDQG